MNQTIQLTCRCGSVTGELKVAPKESFHVKCLCCDCQDFASHLGCDDWVLDEHGGTEIFQTYPVHLTITKGEDKIASLRLTPKGLLRHYTTCCNTPIGNTLDNPKMPFVGIPTAFMTFSSQEERERTLGPLIMQAFGKHAKNGKPLGAHDRFPITFLPKIFAFMAKGYFRGLHKPSPYFQDGKASAPSRILTDKAP